MVLGEVVPEGVAAMPPGPELASLLDTLDPARIPNDDIDDVLVARSRQLAHDQAQMLAVLAEVIVRRPFAGPGEVRRGDTPVPYAADEVRAALAWTRRAAESETDFAFDLVHRLPRVFAALDAGEIDRARAWVFSLHLCDLTDAQVETVCRALLPVAGRLTTGQLGERLRRMVLELDPDHYQRRYRKSVRERRVICYLDADGTATLSASGLPAEDAAAAIERVDSLARAARRHGHPGTLDQIRADLILGLLDGSLHTLTRDQIIDALIGRYAGGSSEPADDATSEIAIMHPRHARDTATTSSDAADCTGVMNARGGDAGSGAEPGAGGESADWTSGGLDTSTVSRACREDGTDASDVTRTTVDDIPTPAGPVTDRPPPEDQRVGVEIRVPLTTLLGRDDRAGELPGLGPVTADSARRTVARQRRAQWRWVVVDTEGHLVSEGITRRRPTGVIRTGPRGGVVELQVTENDLATPTADPGACGEWADVVADIAAQQRAQDPTIRIGNLDTDPHRRFPTAAQRRHVEVRDRTCTFVGCRAPAHRSDADHTIGHHHGGPTVTEDLSPLCRHDHMLKTEGGWELHRPEPGRFVWRSPLGREYPIAPEPILPPRIEHTPREPDPSFDEPVDDTDHPLEVPAQDRAPPPYDPHGDIPLEPRRGDEPARHVRRRPTGGDLNDEPPPF